MPVSRQSFIVSKVGCIYAVYRSVVMLQVAAATESSAEMQAAATVGKSSAYFQ